MRSTVLPLALALALALAMPVALYAYRLEGFADAKEDPEIAKAEKQKNLDTNMQKLIEYCVYMLAIGQVVDPKTKAGVAIDLAINTMSGGALDIKDTSEAMMKRFEEVNQIFLDYLSIDMVRSKQCGVASGIFTKMAFSKLDALAQMVAKTTPPNDTIRMDVLALRKFTYTIKDAVATSIDAVKAYTTLKEFMNSGEKNKPSVITRDWAARVLFCKQPDILLESLKKELDGTKC